MIKIGLIGTGRVAEHYVQISKILKDDILIQAVYDRDRDICSNFAKKHELNYLNNYDQFINQDIDCVFVLTPSGSHFEVAKSVLKLGISVVIEKPVVLNISEGIELEKLAKKNQVFVRSIFQNRLNKPMVLAKSLIGKESLGRPLLGSVKLYWCREQAYYEDEWHGTWGMDGGVLNQQAIHHLDAINWLIGEFDTVYGMGTNLINILEAEDTFSALLFRDDGLQVTFQATTALRPSDKLAELHIVFEKGEIKIGGIALNNLEELVINGEKFDKIYCSSHSETVENGYGNGHHSMFKNYTNIENLGVSISEAISTVKLVHSLYASWETNSEVNCIDMKKSNKLGVK